MVSTVTCDGVCCKVLDFHVTIDDSPFPIVAAVLSIMLVFGIFYLAIKLHKNFNIAVTRTLSPKAPLLPIYHIYTQLMVLWFVLQTLSLLVPAGLLAESLGYILLGGQGFFDNAIAVFLCFRDATNRAVKRSAFIALFISVINTSLTLAVHSKLSCSNCPASMPQPDIIVTYSVWGTMYLFALATVNRVSWFQARPALVYYLRFLCAVYVPASIGLALIISNIDPGFCIMCLSVLVYSIGFAPTLYYVFKKDSKYCAMHMLSEQDMNEVLLPPDEARETESLKENFKDNMEAICHEHPSVNWIDWNQIVLGERIGFGAYGEVFSGTWNGTAVAVKTLFSFKQKVEKEALTDFAKEIVVMSQLRHPNIVLFLGAIFTNEHQCLVTEFMPNGTVFDLLKESNPLSLPWSKRLKILLDAARGVVYLHSFKPPIIHRDLKTQNLLIDSNYNIKIADFGLSRVIEINNPMTRTGTPQWAAPEVIREELYTESADVYSFGIVLWELATFRVPYQGMNAARIAKGVAFDEMRPPLPTNCPPKVVQLMTECWQRDPHKRPDFKTILRRLTEMSHSKDPNIH